jgi:hypothetical protein
MLTDHNTTLNILFSKLSTYLGHKDISYVIKLKKKKLEANQLGSKRITNGFSVSTELLKYI